MSKREPPGKKRSFLCPAETDGLRLAQPISYLIVRLRSISTDGRLAPCAANLLPYRARAQPPSSKQLREMYWKHHGYRARAQPPTSKQLREMYWKHHGQPRGWSELEFEIWWRKTLRQNGVEHVPRGDPRHDSMRAWPTLHIKDYTHRNAMINRELHKAERRMRWEGMAAKLQNEIARALD